MPNSAPIRYALLVCFGALFVLVRVYALFFPGSGWVVTDDELPTGNIAVDLDDGLLLPAPAYQFKPFAAGTMIEGALSWPFRQIVGPNLLALKLAPIALQTLALVFWFLALWRLGGLLAAVVYGTLATFPPPAWLHLSHMAWGNHTEQSLFFGALLYLLSRGLRVRGAGAGFGPGTSFLCGLIAGLGVYFSYSGAPAVIWLVLVLLLLAGRAEAKRLLPAALLGLALGLAPLAWSASFYGWGSLQHIDTYSGYEQGAVLTGRNLFLEEGVRQVAAKTVKLITIDLPASPLYPARWNRALFALLTIGGVALWIGFARAAWQRAWRDWRSGSLSWDGRNGLLVLAVLLYGVLYAAAFVFSGFRVETPPRPLPAHYMDFRYLAPLFPIAFAWIALGLQAAYHRVADRRAARIALLVTIAALLAALVAPYYARVGRGDVSLLVRQVRGDSYFHIVDRLAKTVSLNEWSRARKMAAVAALPPRLHRLFYESIGKAGEQGFQLGVEMAKAEDASFTIDLLRGYGFYWGEKLARMEPHLWEQTLDATLPRVNPSEGPARASFLQGVGVGLARQSRLHPKQVLAVFATWPATRTADLEALTEGIGHFAGATLSYDLHALSDLPPAFWRGHGRQVRRNVENMLLFAAPTAEVLLPKDRHKRQAIIEGYVLGGAMF